MYSYQKGKFRKTIVFIRANVNLHSYEPFQRFDSDLLYLIQSEQTLHDGNNFLTNFKLRCKISKNVLVILREPTRKIFYGDFFTCIIKLLFTVEL